MAQTAALSTDAAAAGLAATLGGAGQAWRSFFPGLPPSCAHHICPLHWHLCGELLLHAVLALLSMLMFIVAPLFPC